MCCVAQEHEFLLMHSERGDEVVSVWVRRMQEQMRILHSKRFPSDLSLASNSSSWSGMSGHSGNRMTTHQVASGHTTTAAAIAGHHYSSGHSLAGHTSLGGGAFQFMEPS